MRGSWGGIKTLPLVPLKKVQTTSGKKAKGRALVIYLKQRLLHYFGFDSDDIILPSVSAPGEDLKFSSSVRAVFPYSVECKNQEISKALYDWYDQAKSNAGNYEPIVVLKRSRQKPLVLVDLDHFLSVVKGNENE